MQLCDEPTHMHFFGSGLQSSTVAVVPLARSPIMAPKRKADELPKAAIELKQMLESLGGVTADNIKDIDYKMRNKATVAIKQSLPPDVVDDYKQLNNDFARHSFIVEYLLDPVAVTCKGKTFVARTSTTTSTSAWVWLTEAELAGPKWLNSTQNASIAISSMQSRLHSTNIALHDAGVLEYRHQIRKEMLEKAVAEGARVEAETVELDQTHYETLATHMSDSRNPIADAPPAKKRQKAKQQPTVELDPEQSEHKALGSSV